MTAGPAFRVLPAGVEFVRLDRRRTVGAARNAGLAHVRTLLVAAADADDLVLDGALEPAPLSTHASVTVDGAVVQGGPVSHVSELCFLE